MNAGGDFVSLGAAAKALCIDAAAIKATCKQNGIRWRGHGSAFRLCLQDLREFLESNNETIFT